MQPVYVVQPGRKPGMPVWAWALSGCGCLGALVIVVLPAILFPVFAQAREKARASSCARNLRMLGLAAQMYEEDYDGVAMSSRHYDLEIAPYIGRKNFLHCPSAPRSASGYAYNDNASMVNVKKVAHPEKLPLIYDSSTLERGAHDPFFSLPNPPRHTRMNQVAYADGHVGKVDQYGKPYVRQ